MRFRSIATLALSLIIIIIIIILCWVYNARQVFHKVKNLLPFSLNTSVTDGQQTGDNHATDAYNASKKTSRQAISAP